MSEIIHYLSTHLSKMIHISPLAARGLIKLAIKDQMGPFFDFNQITFQELITTIKDSLKSRIKRFQITNSDEITVKLEQELILNQSLIEMSKV